MKTFTLEQVRMFTKAQRDAVERYALIFGFFNMNLATVDELQEAQDLLNEVFKNDE
jgi:hypothetical protein